MSIAHKEARESAYWLRLTREAGLLPGARIADGEEETDQLIRILSSILVTECTGLILHSAFCILHSALEERLC